MSKKIRAITFDFWDTLALDDSDEPKRKQMGLNSKVQTRLQLFQNEVQKYHPELGLQEITRAFENANFEFNRLWKEDARTLKVSERLDLMFRNLRQAHTPGFGGLVDAFENMELEVRPDPVPDLASVLETLAQKYSLGIISDTIHTPGRGLKKLLDDWKVLGFFKGFVFSDEFGRSKPDSSVFLEAARLLEVQPEELCHIGDREDKDVVGPAKVGAQSILLTAIVDRRGTDQKSAANFVCNQFSKLPALIAKA